MDITTILTDVTLDAIENMAFMEVTKSDTLTPYDEHLVRLRVEILINKPFPGEMRLILPIGLVSQFTQNMYNIDEADVNDDTMKDVLGEMINIIAGRLMTEITPPDEMFELGLPLVGPDVFVQAEASSLNVEFMADGIPFWIILFGDSFQQNS